MVQRMLVLIGLGLACGTSVSADVVLTETGRVRAAKADKGAAQVGSGLSFVDGSGLEYFIQSDVTFATTSSASGAASEASYTAAVAASTLSGGTTSAILNDAFDGYNSVCFAFDGSLGPCAVSGGGGEGSTPYTAYNNNGPATVDSGCTQGGNALFATQTIGGLQVRREVFVPNAAEFIRFATVITNPTAGTISVNMITANNLGSDAMTLVDDSSSGDRFGDVTDTWITSYQDFSGQTSTDPRLAHVLQQDGFDTLGVVSFNDGDDNPFWVYDLRIDPGATLTILNYATGQPSLTDARNQGILLASSPELSCLTAAEETLYNFGLGPAPAPIPTTGSFGLLALAALVAGAAVVALRLR